MRLFLLVNQRFQHKDIICCAKVFSETCLSFGFDAFTLSEYNLVGWLKHVKVFFRRFGSSSWVVETSFSWYLPSLRIEAAPLNASKIYVPDISMAQALHFVKVSPTKQLPEHRYDASL